MTIPDAVPDAQEVLDYLHRTRDLMDRYQHHKEGLGWAGVVLFIGASSLIVTSAPDRVIGQFGVTVTVLSAFLVTLAYTNGQFNLREFAERVVRSTDRLIVDVISRDPQTMALLPTEFKALMHPVPEDAKKKTPLEMIFPPRLLDDDLGGQFNRPRLLIRKMRQLRAFQEEAFERPGAQPRIEALEKGARLFMLITVIAELLVIWLPD